MHNVRIIMSYDYQNNQQSLKYVNFITPTLFHVISILTVLFFHLSENFFSIDLIISESTDASNFLAKSISDSHSSS